MHENHYSFLGNAVKYLRELIALELEVSRKLIEAAKKEREAAGESKKKGDGVPVSSVATRLAQNQEEVLCIASLDLEPVREELNLFYSQRNGGKPPLDPVCMLRCFILMFLLKFTSFNKWAAHLKGHPELVILSGFEPGDCPAVATLYAFADRLLDGPYKKSCEHHQKPSKRFKGVRNRFRRNLKGEKEKAKKQTQDVLAEKNEGKVEHLVKLALDNASENIPADFLHRIETLLWKVAVIPSAKLGLLGNLKALAASGDGSPVATHAATFGKSLCNCREQGITDCKCDRYYSDPQSTWGWDSHNDCYIFGYRFHVMSIKYKLGDLPIHIMLEGAHTADVVMGIEAVIRVVKLLATHLPGASLEAAIFDLGYDPLWFYKLLCSLNIKPIIPLKSNSMNPSELDNIPRDKDGAPLAPCGSPFRFHQWDKKKGVLVYYCPAKNRGREHGVDMSFCTKGVLCDDSAMGPFCRIPVGDNPRLNPPLPRNTDAFKELYKQRTGSERFFSFSKDAGNLEDRPYRRQHLFLVAGLCHAIALHAKAWVKQRFGKNKAKNAFELLDWLEQMLKEYEKGTQENA